MAERNTSLKNRVTSTNKSTKAKKTIQTWVFDGQEMTAEQIAKAAEISTGGVRFRIRRSGAVPGDNITSIIRENIEVKEHWKSIKNDFDPFMSFVFNGEKTTFQRFVLSFGLRCESAKLYFAKLGVAEGDDITDLVDANELERIKMTEPTYYLYKGLLYTAKGLSRASGLEYSIVVKRLERVKAKPGVDVTPIMKKSNPRKSIVLDEPLWIYCGERMTLLDISSATGVDAKLISKKLKNADVEPGQDATLIIGGGQIAKDTRNKNLLPRWLFNGKKLTVEEIAEQFNYKTSYVEMKIRASKIISGMDVTGVFPEVKSIDRWIYKGKLMTTEEIALATGRTTVSVKRRISSSGIMPNKSVSKLPGL